MNGMRSNFENYHVNIFNFLSNINIEVPPRAKERQHSFYDEIS